MRSSGGGESGLTRDDQEEWRVFCSQFLRTSNLLHVAYVCGEGQEGLARVVGERGEGCRGQGREGL
jgi:hypothetical protein